MISIPANSHKTTYR